MQIPINRFPSLPSLVHDYYYAYDLVGEFYNGDFRDPASYLSQAERVRSRHLPRERLAAILKEQNEGMGGGPAALENIEALAQDQAGVVVTGQQVGLFSGPLYTIYKAFTAIKLAASLGQSHGTRFIPVFWLAAEDHDFIEVNHISLLDRAGRLQKISYEEFLAMSKIPVAKIQLSSAVETCLKSLDDFTPASEFKSAVLSELNQSYLPGLSFAEAFARWMTRLFSDYGLVIIDPSHPELKAMGHEVFFKEISQASPSTKCALKASMRLTQKGYASQVQQQEGKLNLFLAEHERLTIQCRDDVFSIKGEEQTITQAELLVLLQKTPQVFSPNVLLRPLYQDAILPTVAYVGGPGEIAYFAQLKEAYSVFGLPMPIIYPRKSFTLLEKNVERSLVAHSLGIQDVWEGATDTIWEKIARDEIPLSLEHTLQSASTHLDQDMASIKQETAAFEKTLGDLVDSIHRKIRHQLGLLENKVLKASKKRQAIVKQQLFNLDNNLYPDRHLQERVFNITPYLIKYGFGWLDELYQAVDLTHYDHQIFRM